MGKTILTVDDSKIIRMMLRKALTALDYEVVKAKNGKEAIEATSMHNPDLILLDVTMPDMNGLDVLNQIRHNYDHRSKPVIMLTAESNDTTIEKAHSLQVEGYIAKPFRVDQVTDKVSAILMN